MLTHSNIVCADQAASDRFCPVKTGESQRREPFAKLPEGLYRKPYFHIYHIISHSKKIVKAFGHENLDYLCILLKKRIVKSDRIAKGRGVEGVASYRFEMPTHPFHGCPTDFITRL